MARPVLDDIFHHSVIPKEHFCTLICDLAITMKYAQQPICSIFMYALLCAYLIEKSQ